MTRKELLLQIRANAEAGIARCVQKLADPMFKHAHCDVLLHMASGSLWTNKSIFEARIKRVNKLLPRCKDTPLEYERKLQKRLDETIQTFGYSHGLGDIGLEQASIRAELMRIRVRPDGFYIFGVKHA